MSAHKAAIGVNSTTAELFTKIHNRTQSSRALGWDTNDRASNSYRGCGNLSATTFTHTGYTGTQICADPVTGGGLITILLTNRVYPKADEGSLHRIHAARQAFNNAVLSAVQKKRSAMKHDDRARAALAAREDHPLDRRGSAAMVLDGCPGAAITGLLFTEVLNLTAPGLAEVAALHRAGNSSGACNALALHFAAADTAPWLRYAAPRP